MSAEAWAVVDTGFEGHLVVPASLEQRLPPPWQQRRMQTASGEVVTVQAYLGTAEPLDQPGPIDPLILSLGEEYLIGIEVLNHFRVTFDHGQRVIVEP